VTPAQEDTISYAFTEYIDTTIDQLVTTGLTEEQALDTVFTVATTLAEGEVLPEFPDDTAPIIDSAHWLLKAVDVGFIDFCVEVVSERG
jgi:hypothetical protein